MEENGLISEESNGDEFRSDVQRMFGRVSEPFYPLDSLAFTEAYLSESMASYFRL